MNNDADIAVIQAMHIYGGSFAKSLANAWTAADHENRARIQRTWPEYWNNYAELATHMPNPKESHAQTNAWETEEQE